MSFATIPELLQDIRTGRMVLIVDDEDRENEGDLIMAAEMVRPVDINFMGTRTTSMSASATPLRENARQAASTSESVMRGFQRLARMA